MRPVDAMSAHADDRLDAALIDPSRVFASPRAVVLDTRLSRSQKLAVLACWDADGRELSVAEEENMFGGEPNRLREVLLAKLQISSSKTRAHKAPTKHGG